MGEYLGAQISAGHTTVRKVNSVAYTEYIRQNFLIDTETNYYTVTPQVKTLHTKPPF